MYDLLLNKGSQKISLKTGPRQKGRADYSFCDLRWGSEMLVSMAGLGDGVVSQELWLETKLRMSQCHRPPHF